MRSHDLFDRRCPGRGAGRDQLDMAGAVDHSHSDLVAGGAHRPGIALGIGSRDDSVAIAVDQDLADAERARGAAPRCRHRGPADPGGRADQPSDDLGAAAASRRSRRFFEIGKAAEADHAPDRQRISVQDRARRRQIVGRRVDRHFPLGRGRQRLAERIGRLGRLDEFRVEDVERRRAFGEVRDDFAVAEALADRGLERCHHSPFDRGRVGAREPQGDAHAAIAADRRRPRRQPERKMAAGGMARRHDARQVEMVLGGMCAQRVGRGGGVEEGAGIAAAGAVDAAIVDVPDRDAAVGADRRRSSSSRSGRRCRSASSRHGPSARRDADRRPRAATGRRPAARPRHNGSLSSAAGAAGRAGLARPSGRRGHQVRRSPPPSKPLAPAPDRRQGP